MPLDKDVFGDGSVIMLYTPGHTPGHHSLLVKLPQKGAVLLVGDLAHFHENYESNGVPTFNTDRAQSLASLDRVKKIAAGTKATVIIQHDARDIDKLPVFPAVGEITARPAALVDRQLAATGRVTIKTPRDRPESGSTVLMLISRSVKFTQAGGYL